MNLRALLDGIATPDRDAVLRDITLDSREVREGSLFLACRGARHHGLDFAADVAERGAAAILWEPDADRAPPVLRSDLIVTRVPGLSERASEIAGRFFGIPSRQLAIAGITGTNGKTTTAWLLAQALNACGRPAAYLGTLGSAFGGALEAGEFTTPDAVSVQRRLAAFRAQGAACVAMEVSSHALAQSRVAAVHFDAAVFTNLTRDHLDFHGSMDAYAATKASLFAFDDLRLRVINADDPFGAELLSRPAFQRAIATSRRPGFLPQPGRPYLHASDIVPGDAGLRFQLRSRFGDAQIAAPLVGTFNVDNVLAVLAVLLGSGVPLDEAAAAIATVQAPPGRLQTFGGGALPLAVVDYAHTPDALDKVLTALREHCHGRLWCVFGCGGDRDRGKRPEMGRIAGRLADEVIVTDDNPRTESGEEIVRGILAGLPGRRVRVIQDRGTAIATAIAEAAPGDAVLVAGKGHEDYQVVGRERRPFSDVHAVHAALARRGAA
jgi:UDP-N-acetylmuramoyl-L-alanyl-D-glutamate--2,6-diaminopimelate ligase